EDQIDQVQDVPQAVFGGGWVDDDARPLFQPADVLQRPVEVGTRFDVNGQPVRARVGERVEEPLRLYDHEMHIEEALRRFPYRLHDRRYNRQVGDEPTVHDVDVNPIGACLLDGFDPSPSRAKSAERMLGAMSKSVIVRVAWFGERRNA